MKVLMYCKIWIWLNHPKGHFKGQIWLPFYLEAIFSKTVLITFSLFMQEASQEGY